jgi:catechol 2,3-dioxygenase-like lactoylglutathione lyase family enzyme
MPLAKEARMTDSSTADWPTGVDAITLFVEDLDVTKRWYQAVFAKPPIFEDPNSVVFAIGGSVVNLLHVSAVPELIEPAAAALRTDGSGVVLTLAVDDVDAMATELVRRGAQLLNGPMDRPWGIRTASFRDPDGHIWEIARKID